MRILLLGGTGFIGTYLFNHLKKNHPVASTFFSNGNQGILYNVETDNLSEVLKDTKYDLIINAINPENLSYTGSVKNTIDIVNYCKLTDTRLIQVSSIFAQSQNRNLNSYSLKKAISEDIIFQELAPEKYTLLRFPQLFDYEGLGRKSQGGFYYLLDAIKQNKPITLFSNHQECLRNYMPVEILLQIFDCVINNSITGIFNSYIDSFSFKLMELVNVLVKLNPEYNINKLVSFGENKGFTYVLEPQSNELILKLNYQDPFYYFQKAYNAIN